MSVAQDTAFLVFAYLKKERCSQTAASFLTESPSIHQNHLTIDSDSALSLTEIVAEYLELKQKEKQREALSQSLQQSYPAAQNLVGKFLFALDAMQTLANGFPPTLQGPQAPQTPQPAPKPKPPAPVTPLPRGKSDFKVVTFDQGRAITSIARRVMEPPEKRLKMSAESPPKSQTPGFPFSQRNMEDKTISVPPQSAQAIHHSAELEHSPVEGNPGSEGKKNKRKMKPKKLDDRHRELVQEDPFRQIMENAAFQDRVAQAINKAIISPKAPQEAVETTSTEDPSFSPFQLHLGNVLSETEMILNDFLSFDSLSPFDKREDPKPPSGPSKDFEATPTAATKSSSSSSSSSTTTSILQNLDVDQFLPFIPYK